MPGDRLSMRKIREILRLKHENGHSHREIAASCKVSPSTVGEYLSRVRAAGLRWPLPPELDEEALERLLFPPPTLHVGPRSMPDWAEVHTELKRKGMTLALLWEEYKFAQPEGYQYSRFCELYHDWKSHLDPPMRQIHRAGEKMFVDYAGQTVGITDRRTGEVRPTEIFVAVLGASNYTFAEATWTQGLFDWIGSHIRAFEYFGGVPEVVVPDNLKSGVTHPHRYEPDVNPTYQDMSTHYGVAVIPARVRKPRDKAKAENGVLVVERWILARLRNRTFFSLTELNEAIAELLEALNNRPFQKLPGCRMSLFESLEKPVLMPLPTQRYEYAEWKRAAVNIDYHVEVEGHYYSVPFTLAKKKLDVRFTGRTIELFDKGQRVASHRRAFKKGQHTTITEHMPKNHQQHLEWTPQRLTAWAGKTGPSTERMASEIMASRMHPQQGFRSVLGLMRLGETYGEDRLEAACRRALALRAFSYKSVQSILKTGLDRKPLPESADRQPLPIDHEHIRGSDYYQ